VRRLRLAAYGNSVFLRGIAACLAADPLLTVFLVDSATTDARARLEVLAPDAIAFEVDAAFRALPMSMSLERPGLLLVVLDPASDEVIVLAGRRAQPTTAGDLVDVLVRMTPEPELKA
jgi:hypothetical protein